MKKYGLNELRELFLSFFEEKGHLRLQSFPLIPQDEDKSLLLINSGMAPMKPWFTGEKDPPSRRVCTCQKCIRTGDIENVGKTARHGTYFEMLGNFSFGDYFKREAITWCWEFLTDRLGIPPELLYPSVYLEDDEAFEIWTKEIGIAPERVTKLGKADNFWEHGSGPCGPCSEVYFDRGETAGCGSPECAPGCDCDRFVEIWNNVFTQFDSDGEGNYTELSQKNIDTGLGLERLAAVCQGVGNLFEVDTVIRIIREVSRMSGTSYGADAATDVSIRVITDHIRSATMLIGDGVRPTNEGRGYVLRRLLRRAARHGRLLGIEGTFLCDLCGTVIEENKSAYPDLAEKAEYIARVIRVEEENFGKTIDSGMSMLAELIGKYKKACETTLSGEDAFKLYDTYGFPLDLTVDILSENGMDVDHKAFDAAMEAQRTRARAARAQGAAFGGVSGATGVGDESSSHPPIMRAHTATHLLHAALRRTLGDYAQQAGSLVEEDKLRFDFKHDSALTKDEIAQIEKAVNDAILEGIDVCCEEMPLDEAKKRGAIALFGEKYGDMVRVVTMGDMSIELCGGTHLDNTAKVGAFNITAEFSVASGTRRIEATCGEETLLTLQRAQANLAALVDTLKAGSADELCGKVEQNLTELRDARAKLSSLAAKESVGEAERLLQNARDIDGLKVITFEGDDPDALRQMADALRDKEDSVVAVLAAVRDGKITIAASCGPTAVKRGVKAGDIVREVTKRCDGSGGGKPNFAMGGGKDPTRLKDAFDAVDGLIKGALQ